MKLIFIFILSALFPTFSNAQISKAELIANGLTCSMCSNATYNQLRKLSFLDSIYTDVENTKFILYFNPNVPYDFTSDQVQS